MNRSVLIIDDEQYIRKGIRAILERSECSFSVIHEAINGIEGLECISRIKFDLIITDIRMPGMDGITLMKKVREQQQNPKFIIFSAYNDFQYAKEAIDLGAKAYILKPIIREELIEIVKKVEQELVKDELLNAKEMKVASILDNFREHELNFIMSNEELSEHEISERISAIDAGELLKAYYIAVFYRNSVFGNKLVWNSSMQIKALAVSFLERKGSSSICYLNAEGSLVLISHTDSELDELINHISDRTGDSIAAGRSMRSDSAIELKKCYMQAAEALKYRVLKNATKVIRPEDIAANVKVNEVPTETIKKIPQLVGTKRTRELIVALNEIFDLVSSEHTQISFVERLVKELYKLVVENLMERFPQKASDMRDITDRLKSMYWFESFIEYFKCLKNYLVQMDEFILLITDSYRGKHEIDAALDYISKNYNKNLSMSTVANHVSLNYSYFSFVFSEKTGMTFVDYLRKVRIENAKELLEKSDNKINEIAEMVGYQNSKYFTKSFKQLTGLSPGEYRENFSSKPG